MDQIIVKKKLERKRKKRKKIKNYTKGFFLALLFAMFCVFLIDRFVISVLTIDGNSMQSTLFEGDKVLVSKLNISEEKIEKDDIIFFKGTDDRSYIKRVIGVPGDVVEIVNNKVLINGIQKIEDYTRGESTETYNQNKWFVGSGEYFVLGDNRLKNSSKDSRIFGTIKIDQVKGKVIYNFSSER